jgi:predicted GIY-YIG superfamily endonuclease
MFYTYILRSISQPEQRYIGSTSDLKSRLIKHNSGEVPHTSKFKLWRIQTAIAFDSKEKAIAFEAYLKTGSGRSFANRHF